MAKFPFKLLNPEVALLSGQVGDACLEVLIQPFTLNEELIYTSIRLDCINIPYLSLFELADKAFDFPTNPEEGYIDGTIYIESAHHPVDVTNLTFHRSRENTVTVVLKGVLEYAWPDQYEKTSFSFGVRLASLSL